MVTAAALASLHETEKLELKITLWENLVFYTGGERMKEGMEWCRGSQGAGRREEGKNGKREDSQERNLLQGVLQLCITSFFLENVRI